MSVSDGTHNLNYQHPWPGLHPYLESDVEFFRGREIAIDNLFRAVMRRKLTVFYGKSGLGKTSILNAGLAPRARLENVFPVYIRLNYDAEPPVAIENQVFAQIRSQSEDWKVIAPLHEPNQSLWEYIQHRKNHFWNNKNRIVIPLLIIDQFEEIFTLGRSNPEKLAASRDFLTILGDLIEGRPPKKILRQFEEEPKLIEKYSFNPDRCRIVLSLREDFLGDLEKYRERIPSLTHNRVQLLPMNRSEAIEAVSQSSVKQFTRDAEVSKASLVEDNAVDAIVDLVSNFKNEVSPALISLVCSELNKVRLDSIDEPSDGNSNVARITAEMVESNKETIIDDFYERSMRSAGRKVRRYVEDRLVTASGYRASVNLETAEDDLGKSFTSLENLVTRRILRIEARVDAQNHIELSHDLLAAIAKKSRESRLAWWRAFLSYTSFALVAILIVTVFSSLFLIAKTEPEVQTELASAVLDVDVGELKRLLGKAIKEESIELKVSYIQTSSNEGGTDQFGFEILPIPSEKLAEVRNVVYLIEKSGSENLIIPGSRSKNFAVTLPGPKCVDKVTAAIEYLDSQELSKVEFNVCESWLEGIETDSWLEGIKTIMIYYLEGDPESKQVALSIKQAIKERSPFAGDVATRITTLKQFRDWEFLDSNPRKQINEGDSDKISEDVSEIRFSKNVGNRGGDEEYAAKQLHAFFFALRGLDEFRTQEVRQEANENLTIFVAPPNSTGQ